MKSLQEVISEAKLGFKLAPLQVSDIARAIEHDRFGWFLDVGVGKTVCSSLTAIAWDDEVTIVLCPPILLDDWCDWLKSIGQLDVEIYRGADRTVSMLNHRWVIMSHNIFRDSFATLQAVYAKVKLSLIVDEAQALKNPKSKFFQNVRVILEPDRRVQLLSGTPISKPEDTYTYMALKTPGLYRSAGHWNNLHVGSRDIFKAITSYANLDILAKNFALNSVKRTKEEVFGYDLTPIYKPLRYRLAQPHEALYSQLVEEQLLLYEDGSKIDATTPQKLRHALQQVVVNWEKFSGNADHRSTAYDLIDQTIEEVNPMDQKSSKLIIWTYYQATSAGVTKYLRQKYGDEAVASAYGLVDSHAGVKAIMHDPKCRIFVAQISSVGAGLNLQHNCSEALFIEMSTSAIQMEQAIGRIARMGQKVRPTIRLAMAKFTVQSGMLARLMTNLKLVDRVVKPSMEKGRVKSLREDLLGAQDFSD